MSEQPDLDYRATVRLRDCAEDVAVYVATWQDDGLDGAQRRQALGEAVDAIDAMLRTLHELRGRLVDQERSFDDEAMRRSGELLERLRKERES